MIGTSMAADVGVSARLRSRYRARTSGSLRSVPEAEWPDRRAEGLAQELGADRERFDAAWGLSTLVR